MKALIFLLAIVTSHAPQAFAVGTANVVASHGDTFVTSNGPEHVLKIGEKINDQDTVRTAANGLLIIAFADGTRLKIKESSQLVVHVNAKTSEPSSVDLAVGAVFALVTKGGSRHFEVKTKAAIAGVRGTEFFVSQNGKGNFWLCVQDGVVDVTPIGGAAIPVKKGLGILVEPGKSPEAPKFYEWTKNLNWNMDPENGDVDDHTVIKK